MDAFLAILPGILVPVIIVVIIIGFCYAIKRKINKFTKDALGMSPKEAMNMISEGIKNETTLPKPITTLSSVYSPMIARDFPQMGYEGMRQIAENAINEVLNAIETKSTDKLDEKISSSLFSKVEGIINDLNSKGITEKYYNKKIHKSGIASYSKNGETATAKFEISMQYDYSKEDNDGKVLEKKDTMQVAYRVILTYDQNIHEKTTNIVYSSTCPNCGAPINAADGKCRYCGGMFTEIADRIWLVSDFNLIK